MKFAVATYGTEGDTRPLSALCRALVDAGHEARLLADAATLSTAESLGISTVVLAGDIRGTLQSSGSGMDTASLPANFFVVGDTPHSWLFPKTSLVIHHGGSGTTHSAARAGVPSVVVPFAGDQFFWADRLRQAGAAGGAVNGKDLRAQALTLAIEFAETDPVRTRVRALGERMRAEDGLADATVAIEKIMAR